MISINTTGILFVSNFSNFLNETEDKVASYLPQNCKYKILTYKVCEINNSFSYENFIEKNFASINKCDSNYFSNKFHGVNFNLPIVAERFLSDYYMLDGALGHRHYCFEDVQFILKSWILFLDQHIQSCEIVFSGYADNIVSHLTFLLSEYYGKQCISFGPKNVINHETCYLTSGLFAKPYHDLVNNKPKMDVSLLAKYIENYDMRHQIQRAYKDTKGLSKPILGMYSANIISRNFWRYTLFGYKTKNKSLKIFLELDRVDLYSKVKSYVRRTYNALSTKFFYKFVKDVIPLNTKIVYLPLQVQPEASTSVTSPYFMNLQSTVEYVSKSLPLGFILVVKDHPAVKGMRSISFLKKIRSLPNVYLVNPKKSAKNLMTLSTLIIGFGGTTLLEAISLGKKILIFEDSFYSQGKLVHRLKEYRNLHDEILDFSNLEISDDRKKKELEDMLNYFHQRGFPRYTNFEKNMAVNLMKIYNDR